ncbi:uncharacterized protein LOC133299044 [Gastrolobium bilobum]|uniref:uncharacterized protein LOC133299044 n=1 Tax=Gastrolobium bilobum TaxID=150636 RepID=UPI002AB16CEF|nr:uncharacterized protein LOC133299044 [Gastrolobium bilobum]
MALDGKKGEDMDSLFEGMVLFNTAQIEVELRPDDIQDEDSLQSDAVPTSKAASSQPLDENLFSDLTLIVPPLQNLEVTEAEHDLQSQQPSISATTAAAITTRQASRRRKRSGLRIGYGRDTIFSNDLPQSPSSLPQTALQISDNLPSDTRTDSVGDTLPSSITADVVVTQPCTESSSLHDGSKSDYENRKDEDVSQDGETFSEAEFQQIKARIHEKLNHARQLVNAASAVRKGSIRNRRKAAENANLVSLKHMELEKQLEEACEAEDFERAEKVSENLSAAEKDRQAFANSLREADAIIDALDLKLQHALDSLIAAEEESAVLLEHYAMNASNNADFALKKATSVHSKEMNQWLSSSEALEVKKMELEIESHFISEAHLDLNNTIEHSIQDDKREKDILCERKDMLMVELENLLALVEQKQKEIADNDSNLKAVENKMSNVVSGFKEIRSSIDVMYDKLQSVLAQVKLESETLALKKEEIDNFLIQEEEMGAKRREIVRISEEEAKGYWEIVELRRRLMSSILKSREDKLTLANNEEKLSEDLKLFQQEVSAARASLQELSSRKSNIQQDIASFKQRIIFIDKRVPELEAEKKVATAARNFKEAARITTEAKSLSVEKEGMQIDMDSATLNLEKLEEEIEDTLNKLQETEGVILLKEKELAMARYQRLLLTASTARAEKAATLEMGDVEEANLLLAEAEAADCEAEKLQSTYNFKAEDFTSLRKQLISMDLVSYLDQKQLAELAVSLDIFTG